jgi:hypothetical protein
MALDGRRANFPHPITLFPNDLFSFTPFLLKDKCGLNLHLRSWSRSRGQSQKGRMQREALLASVAQSSVAMGVLGSWEASLRLDTGQKATVAIRKQTSQSEGTM